jgi:hypothetical protein
LSSGPFLAEARGQRDPARASQHEATGAIDRASIVILCVSNVSHEIDGRLAHHPPDGQGILGQTIAAASIAT